MGGEKTTYKSGYGQTRGTGEYVTMSLVELAWAGFAGWSWLWLPDDRSPREGSVHYSCPVGKFMICHHPMPYTLPLEIIVTGD